MKPIADMNAAELAAFVCTHLANHDIDVVLTGGNAVAILANNAFVSMDLDFVERISVPRRQIRAAMAKVGFTEKNRYFEHSDTEIIVEFPSGPLAVGRQPVEVIAEKQFVTGLLKMLTPTDCVKDRLAAYIHWNDEQGLQQAIAVAQANDINLDEIRTWATAEGAEKQFAVFNNYLNGN